jgi:hypothetical protein
VRNWHHHAPFFGVWQRAPEPEKIPRGRTSGDPPRLDNSGVDWLAHLTGRRRRVDHCCFRVSPFARSLRRATETRAAAGRFRAVLDFSNPETWPQHQHQQPATSGCRQAASREVAAEVSQTVIPAMRLDARDAQGIVMFLATRTCRVMLQMLPDLAAMLQRVIAENWPSCIRQTDTASWDRSMYVGRRCGCQPRLPLQVGVSSQSSPGISVTSIQIHRGAPEPCSRAVPD